MALTTSIRFSVGGKIPHKMRFTNLTQSAQYLKLRGRTKKAVVKHCVGIYLFQMDQNSHPQFHHHRIQLKELELRGTQRKCSQIDNLQKSDDDNFVGFIIGICATTAKTRIDHHKKTKSSTFFFF